MRIHIKTYCTSHISRSDGAYLYQAIKDHWNDKDPIVLDFEGVRIASTGFLDEAIGLFAKDFTLEVLRERIHIENIDVNDRKLLNYIVNMRANKNETL